ncbi:putative alpha-1,2-mannosidase [Gelidibacter algens]|uniref:Putative alpha-1,2-mannosidase n=1 Tax=Gelidibacter algens TaxID=49280 RepID=A0A1A7R2V3_9FLAO|nr:GH92 family glycosyl hydrolase [Gelidibacter algens]OBX25097.1 glycosyl hydrolase family 92 [Gelidibacter algens]RAJ23035.1 putative alpha-1,2-mannosidase [Gelidibacter algens]
MKSFLLAISVLFLCIGCADHPETTPAKKDTSLVSLVNPFIGTGGHGHTYPGATMPFGMMQLSPDTRLEGWDGASGYHYTDTHIYGFTHTHLSGTGITDYGDVLLMPTNEVVFNNGSNGKKGYRSKFSHDTEKAEPGYYKVHLEDTDIDVELTVSERSGIHKYQFPTSKNQIIVLDLVHRDQLMASKIKQISRTEITGYRHSKAWATNQKLFYYIKFSHPLSVDLIASKQKLTHKKAVFQFDNPKNEPVYVKIGISAVDEEGAKKNLQTEIGDQTFDQIKANAQNVWEKQLEKIVIESDNQDRKITFYTALYHTMIAPNLYQDVDGRYRGMDLKIHSTKEFKYYTVFSLWDTYRAAHPLYSIIERKRTSDFINTLIAKYDEGGILPMWDLSANYTGTMIGYHAVPVIADAYLKGIKGFDAEKAFKAMKHSANQDHLGLKSYKAFGFIPVEEESESVSKTLEYAYDDWTLAKMAYALDKDDDYETYLKRAQNYKNVFDPETKFMRGRFKNTWFSPFDPFEVNFNYTEANAWQYSFYVPQDVSGFIDILGGKEVLEAQLDTLFTATSKTSGRDQVDITGLIGQYAHGNEPSHHMAYLYNFVNKPYKTQEKVHQILTELYKNEPDGIAGNEDCGQMSAWYIFSAMGFYPVTPGSNDYIIGTPLFEKATINLENGKNFTIKAFDLSDENKYIDYAELNGSRLDKTYITSNDILSGGILEFYMTDSPSDWGTDDDDVPTTSIDNFKIVPVPFIAKGDLAFKVDTEVTLGNAQKETDIFYTLNDSVFVKYETPFIISEPATLKVYSEKDGEKSATLATTFYKIDPNRTITLNTNYTNQYSAGGTNALIDGMKGTKDYRTGSWQGYQDQDVVAIVDLGEEQPIQSVSLNFLQDQRSWIFYPTEVFCYVSTDNQNFQFIGKQSLNAAKRSDETKIRTITFDLKDKNAKYIKLIAKKMGKLPTWHLGYPEDGRSFIFVDEISIE